MLLLDSIRRFCGSGHPDPEFDSSSAYAVGFAIGHEELEQREPHIDHLDQTIPLCQRMEQSDTAAGDGKCFVVDLVVKDAGREQDRKVMLLHVLSTLNPVLASGEQAAKNDVRLKSFCG